MTKPWREYSYKQLSKEEGETRGSDQRNLITQASIADTIAEVENDQHESVMKLTQAYDM